MRNMGAMVGIDETYPLKMAEFLEKALK